jgi:hypothetical protein
MNADKETVVQHAVAAARDQSWRRGLWIRYAIAAAAFLVAGYFLAHLYMRTGELADQQSQAAVAAERLAGQVRAFGATPVVQPPAPIAGPTGAAGKTGPAGPGPTQQQIDDAVAGYFAEHPPGPTPAEVGAQVAAFLTLHPPKQGAPPTPTQIATAASDYIAAHAQQFTGPTGQNGSDGQPGQNATDDQVAAAVAAYCSSHNQCQGSSGGTGAQGVSVSDVEFQRDSSGACMVVVTLHDPSSGNDSTVTHPAGDAACQAPPATTTTSQPPALLGGLKH